MVLPAESDSALGEANDVADEGCEFRLADVEVPTESARLVTVTEAEITTREIQD